MLALANLKSIFKVSPIITAVTLPDAPVFSILYVNDPFLQITGGQPADFEQKSLPDILLHLSDALVVQRQPITNLLQEASGTKSSSQLSTADWRITVTPIINALNEVEFLVQTYERATMPAQNVEPIAKTYQDLFNLSPLPHWVYGMQTLHFLDVNDAAIAHYGYTKDEFLSMTLADIRPAEDLDILNVIINDTIQKGLYNKSIVRHQKKNGDIITVVVQGNSIRFQNQDARLVLAIDHTDNIKAENELAASERRFKALIQEGSDLIAILDHDGYYRYVNPSARSILGMDAEFFKGKNAFDLIHQDDRPAVLQQLKELEVVHRIRISPYRFKTGTNQYRWLETTVTNMTDDPAISGFVSNSRDVTKQIDYEQKMEDSIARFAIVSKATRDAIWDRDILSDKVIWNKGIKGIFGHDRLESTYQWWYRHVHPEDVEEVVKKIQLLIKNKESRLTVEYRFRCAEGNYKYINDRAFLLFDNNGEAIRMIGSMQDITDRVEYIKAMEQQNDRLRDISWMQSHHVRAPLARILGLTSLLAVNSNSREETTEFLQHLTNSSIELDEIIREIVKKTEGI